MEIYYYQQKSIIDYLRVESMNIVPENMQWMLKSQWQIWDILQGVSSLGVLVHKKIFSLIWQVVFKLGHLLCQKRYPTPFEFEWTRRKVASDNN